MSPRPDRAAGSLRAAASQEPIEGPRRALSGAGP